MVAALTPDLIDEAALRLRLRSLADPWGKTRRPSQIPPDGDWNIWLIMAGRGFGKTRTTAEWVREQITKHGARRVALVGPTAADVRDVMVEGESGLLACCERYGIRATYQPSRRRVIFPNGAKAFMYSADEPDRLRGPQHDAAAADELAAWRYPAAYDHLRFGLRLGTKPRLVIATTPKPVAIIRSLLAQSRESRSDVLVTRGTMAENRANLAPSTVEDLERRYGGTRLGRQELMGELLEDVEGALWSHAMIEATRVKEAPEKLRRIVVAVDPATTHGDDADFTGIAVCAQSLNGHYYVLNAEQVRLSPHGWASRAIALYHEHQADCIVAETNQGGEMVEATIRNVDRYPRIRTIHATRGKTLRAEPVVALYECGEVHHVGVLADLEQQMTTFPVATDHDDVLDATVYALTELIGNVRKQGAWVMNR